MYLIKETKSFRISYKKLKVSGLSGAVLEDIKNVIKILSLGKNLPKDYKDDELTGDLRGYRDCHIKGDLLLVYTKKEDKLILILLDIGSHSKIFGH